MNTAEFVAALIMGQLVGATLGAGAVFSAIRHQRGDSYLYVATLVPNTCYMVFTALRAAWPATVALAVEAVLIIVIVARLTIAGRRFRAVMNARTANISAQMGAELGGRSPNGGSPDANRP